MFRSSRLWNLLMTLCSYTMTNTNCWLAQWIRQSHHILILHTHSLFLQMTTQLLVNTDFHYTHIIWFQAQFCDPLMNPTYCTHPNWNSQHWLKLTNKQQRLFTRRITFPYEWVFIISTTICTSHHKTNCTTLQQMLCDHLVKWKCSSSLSSSSSTWTFYANLKQSLLKYSSL